MKRAKNGVMEEKFNFNKGHPLLNTSSFYPKVTSKISKTALLNFIIKTDQDTFLVTEGLIIIIVQYCYTTR